MMGCFPHSRSIGFVVATTMLLLVCAVGLDCWAGDFTFEVCCDPQLGPQGNQACWDGRFTYDVCCRGQRQSSGVPRQASAASSATRSLARQKQAIDGVVVGIDLGTTYSAVSIFRNGRSEVIQNDQGNRITPSMVAFLDSGERLVGEAAKNLMSSQPKQVIYDAKRLIGRGFDDRSVQRDKRTFPFRVIDRAGRPHIEVDRAGGKRNVLAPEEVSALVLAKMKAIAEAYLGEGVRHAVVTVPAYFNDNQRSATMVAGEISGLNVVRVINEPTAAAMAYGLSKPRARSKGPSEIRALVYDLGGGTFDVSLLSIADGVFETLATCGNTHLGGQDFDLNVVNFLVDRFKHRHGMDLSGDKRAMQRLKGAAERAKRDLSTVVSTRVEVEGLFAGRDLVERLTRSKFEQLNEDLFAKTLEPVKRVLKDAGVTKTDVHEILLVGGSTRIPRIQRLVQEFFNLPKLPTHKVNPDEAVAIGAAIQAEILWRGSVQGQALTTGKSMWGSLMMGTAPSQEIVLVDVTPLSLGIEIQGGAMVVLIPRNSALPTTRSKVFSTVHDHQTTVYIPIYQGERQVANKNSKLGQMILSGIPPAPVGVPQIEVVFRIDTNGILHVTAQDQGTKQAASVSISAHKGRLSDEEVERMIQKAQRHAQRDEELLSRRDARAALGTYMNSLRSSVLAQMPERLTEEDRSELEAAISDASKWLENDAAKATVTEIQEQRQSLESIANPIVMRLYGKSAPRAPSDSMDSGSASSGSQLEREKEDAVVDLDEPIDDEYDQDADL